MTYIRWATMWHILWDNRTREVTWCGRKIPPDAERSDAAPRSLICAVCLASEEG
jgi:hypothetical protein